MADRYFREPWFIPGLIDNGAGVEDRSAPFSPATMSTLNELVRLLGSDFNKPNADVCKALREVLEFCLSANERERQSTVVSCMGSDRQTKRIKLIWKDVGQGAGVVYLLEKKVNPAVRLQTTKYLADLAESPQNQVKIANSSAVMDVLMTQLHTGYGVSGRELLADVFLSQVQKAWSSSLNEHTARCLANLALKQENHMKMASSTVLEPLVKLLKINGQPPQVYQQAARFLTNLAASNQNKERIGSYPGVLAALAGLLIKQVSILNCQTAQEAHEAQKLMYKQIINCLTSLASSQKIQVKIVSNYPTVLNALVQFLGGKGNSDLQQESLKCLTSLSENYQSTQVDIASHSGVLDALLRLVRTNWLTTDRITVQVEALTCLLKLLSAPENLLKIASHDGALDALVICLDPSRRNRKVRYAAVVCLTSLAAAPENQLEMVKFPGLVSALVNQLEISLPVEKADGQELAVWCLSKLAIASKTKEPLTFCRGLLTSLVALLNKPEPALVEPALKCLVNLAQSDSFSVKTKITCHGGVIDALVRLLGSNLDGNLLEKTVQCLSDLALSPLNAKHIVAHPEVLQSLVKLLEHNSNSGVLEYTVKCLANLSCLEENQLKMVFFPGTLNALVLSLSFRSEITEGIQEQVVKCIAQLSGNSNDSCKKEIAEFPGVHDTLLRLATDNAGPRSRLRQGALQCLANLRLSPVAARERKIVSRINSRGGTSRLSPLGRQLDNSEEDPDHWSVDPITYEIMCDPVKCNDGVTYDRWTIINNGLRQSPIDRSLTRFYIACDDLDVRRRLFRKLPDQEVKFRWHRKTYREKAFQFAHSLDFEETIASQSTRANDFEDAIKMLNNVLMWAPLDAECKTELDKILTLVRERSSSFQRQPEESSLVFPGSPDHSQRVLEAEIHVVSSSTIPLRVEESQTSSIPIVLSPQDPIRTPREIPTLSHDALMRVREQQGSRKALIYILFCFSLYFAIFF